MLNVEESSHTILDYHQDQDIIYNVIGAAICSTLYVDIIRQQIPETRLLQLIPGSYIFILFTSFCSILFNAEVVFGTLMSDIDRRKELGSKTKGRLDVINVSKFNFSILLFCIVFASTSLIPISFESFQAFEVYTVENYWSLQDIFTIENILITFVVNIAQFPSIPICNASTKEEPKFYRRWWREVSFTSIFISGVITPTVDGLTQLLFALFIISIYFYTIWYTETRDKRENVGLLTLSF